MWFQLAGCQRGRIFKFTLQLFIKHRDCINDMEMIVSMYRAEIYPERIRIDYLIYDWRLLLHPERF